METQIRYITSSSAGLLGVCVSECDCVGKVQHCADPHFPALPYPHSLSLWVAFPTFRVTRPAALSPVQKALYDAIFFLLAHNILSFFACELPRKALQCSHFVNVLPVQLVLMVVPSSLF